MSNISSLTLYADFYSLTMACAAYRAGFKDHKAIYHLSFGEAPFGGNFAVACGLGTAIEMVQAFRFSEEDLVYLSEVKANDGNRLFDNAFLEYLQKLRFDGSMYAVPEGSIVFPNTPILRLEGTLIQCLLLETMLQNTLGFQTLIATKAARMCIAAKDKPVIEMGLRYAHGMDGAIAATRAAYIGGCAASSNALAGNWEDIPVRGTFNQTWMQLFGQEVQAFAAYAGAMPNNCTLLVDTRNPVQGAFMAASVGKQLHDYGFSLTGVRLEKGATIAEDALKVRSILDNAALKHVAIVAAPPALDENQIAALVEKGAPINVFGAGAALTAAAGSNGWMLRSDLSALFTPQEGWDYRVGTRAGLLSGQLQVYRMHKANGRHVADMVYHEAAETQGTLLLDEAGKRHEMAGNEGFNLLSPVFERGKLLLLDRDIHQKRAYGIEQRGRFTQQVLALKKPAAYLVGTEAGWGE